MGQGFNVEERVAALFQPDTLLPTQYFETFRNKSNLGPEKRLMLAVLDDAIACFKKHLFAQNDKGKALFRDVEGWILERDGDWLFSFDNVCEILGFNPEYMRLGLMRWKEAKLAEAKGREEIPPLA